MKEFDWAQAKIREVVYSDTLDWTKEKREGAACQRRLRQMEVKRAKQAARKAKSILTTP